MSDWYGFTRKEVSQSGGRKLFRRYLSLEAVLRAIYPEFEWDASKFVAEGRNPNGYWSLLEKQRAFLGNVGEGLGVKQVSSCTYTLRIGRTHNNNNNNKALGLVFGVTKGYIAEGWWPVDQTVLLHGRAP